MHIKYFKKNVNSWITLKQNKINWKIKEKSFLLRYFYVSQCSYTHVQNSINILKYLIDVTSINNEYSILDLKEADIFANKSNILINCNIE